MNRPPPTDREAPAMTSKTEQLREPLTDGVAALIDSEQWAAMLAATAKSHCYSANNQLLILLQAPQATRVAGFRRWQSLGRQVRKGEKGIAILAPCLYRPSKTSTAAQEHNTSTASNSDGETTGPRSAGQLRGMRVGHVFALSQTDGEPLAEITPEPLTGAAPAAMWAALAEQVGAHGYRIERGECRGANGYTDPAGRLVRIRADIAEAMAARVLAHELAHLECGHCEHGSYRCRGRREVQAESVAWLISAHFGLDTGAYTLPYVAGWAHAADRAGAVEQVRQAFAAVSAAHRRILTALDRGTAAGEDSAA